MSVLCLRGKQPQSLMTMLGASLCAQWVLPGLTLAWPVAQADRSGDKEDFC